MKKFAAILLAVVMMLSMSAMAASITINTNIPTDATSTNTYDAYLIFSADISESGVAYTMAADSPFKSVVENAGFTLTPSANDADVLVVTIPVGFDAEADAISLADSLKAVITTSTEKAGTVTTNGATAVIDELDPGYYLVVSSVGSDLILYTLDDVTIDTKNEYPSLEKKVSNKDSETADMGDTLTFTIEVTIPTNAVGAIVVHDKMTGLEYVDMTEVDGITDAATGLTDDCTVEFTLSAEYVEDNLGETVIITYTAKVTADIANNEAWLVDDEFTSKSDNTPVYSTDVEINKVDANNEETKLEGATFVLKNSEGKFYAVDASGNVSWVDAQNTATTFVTGNNGKVTINNLADGTYYLVETVAPTGYNLLTEAVEVEVKAIPVTDADGNVTSITAVPVTVENSTGSELPSTGGMGTTVFYVVGGLMMAAAVVLLVARKKVAAK